MATDEGQKQLDKWRKQERNNQLLIRSVVGIILVAAVAGIAVFLVFQFRGPPTLTPSELGQNMKGREGQTVRVKGRVDWIDGSKLRVADTGASIMCQFAEPPMDQKEGNEVTVQGKVGPYGLTKCRILGD